MKLNASALTVLKQNSDVSVGNVYPAKGGRKPGTDYWVVVALTENGAHLLGFNKDGVAVSTASYLKGALRERPIIGRCKIDHLTLELL